MKNFYWKINYFYYIIIQLNYLFKEDNFLINNVILDIKILLSKIK